MRKENVYVNESNQEEFISKNFMRRRLYDELIMHYEIIFYHQCEKIRCKDSAEYERNVIRRRLKKISHLTESAALFGIISDDEERLMIDYTCTIENALCKPDRLALIPDLNFLIRKRPEPHKTVATWDECCGFLVTRGAQSDMTFQALNKLMRYFDMYNLDEDVPLSVIWD